MTVPKELDLFNIDSERFPLLAEVEEYILEATLEKGDCVFIPSLYWFQWETQGHRSIIMSWDYSASSVLVDLFFQAINQNLHKEDDAFF